RLRLLRLRGRRAPAANSGRRRPWCGGGGRWSPRGCAMRGSRTVTLNRLAAATLPLDQRAVLPDEQVEMLALLVGKLEEDLLALRILEALAVLLEEPVGVALATDADEQRLLIVDAAQQTIRAFGEQAVRGALEEKEGRPRFKLRI